MNEEYKYNEIERIFERIEENVLFSTSVDLVGMIQLDTHSSINTCNECNSNCNCLSMFFRSICSNRKFSFDELHNARVYIGFSYTQPQFNVKI